MDQSSSQHRIGIFIPDHCSLLTLGAITEPLAHVNQILGENKYQVVYVGETCGSAVTVSKSPVPLTITVQNELSDLSDIDMLVVIAGEQPRSPVEPSIKLALQHFYAQDNTQIVTLQAGCFWLLASDIGLNEKWSIHWQWQDEIKAHYPDLDARYEGYFDNGKLVSCASHHDIIHYLLSYLSKTENEVTTRTVADNLYIEQNDESSPLTSNNHPTELQPRLKKAIALMESNLEEPLSAEIIADLVHVSRRQLERLFKRYLDTMPARYYLQLRLRKARELLQTTNQSVVQIGLMCGFSSGPHFSSAYKSYFSITPREERAKRFYATKDI